MNWLSARPVGASLVEFLQKLPTEEAEKLHAASLELERLKSEDERHVKLASDIQSWSVIGGVIGVVGLDALLSSSIARTPLLVVDGIVAAGIWWIASQAIRRQFSLAGKVTIERLEIEEDVFKRIGIVYSEAEGRVHSVARLSERHKEIQQQLRESNAVYEEIRKGDFLGREAGISPTLFQHRTNLLSPVLGGLPTQELVEHPDCERLFLEMSKLGLRDQTAEAILARRSEVHSLISRRTLEIARARLKSAG